MQKQVPNCCVGNIEFREFKGCNEPAQYGAHVVLSNGRELKMDLCSRHMRNCVRIAEVQAARLFPGEKAKVNSMSFHHLALGERKAS